ncbi:WecB/TagA/CpsF family glycosyltransferase [Jejudonia soesokkakensis]|uniref:WecB/TagA/CpsF family glycosyltransferase n=1 Tax=Jejudonia soesokkakensis TaxID=1323432 RepID=A0ABW2MQI9_9FLAO
MKKKIITSHISQGSLESHLPAILKLAKDRTPSYCCFTNVHMLIEAYDDPAFNTVVNEATYAFPDGAPVAKMFQKLYNIEQERIAGMDFLPFFIEKCDQHALNIAFVGSTDSVLEKIKVKIASEYKNITITALISPPFGKPWDNEAYIEIINAAKTNVVFVGLGCPKQEKWMYEHSAKINAILFGLGGAFPVYVDEIKRAPSWMRNNSLEWLYRLLMEPKRMFKRYYYTNTKFLRLASTQIKNK